MTIIKDITQNKNPDCLCLSDCGWDGDDSCVGDTGCSDLICSGSVSH